MEPTAKKKVLVVEDEKALLDFFVFDLAAAGYEVLSASDGDIALQVLRANPVDAVVSDIRLPKRSGIEVLEHIRTTQNPAGPAFLFISGNLELRTEQYYHFGASAFFFKPFNRQELLESLSHFLLPTAERWKMTPELAATAKGKLELELESYASASTEGILRFGQGGFFLALEADMPEPGDILAFQIKFQDQPALNYEGVGGVRWVRHRSDSMGRSGIGVEILGLADLSMEALGALLQKHQPIPFIPKA